MREELPPAPQTEDAVGDWPPDTDPDKRELWTEVVQ
ncbi:hypothetical protein ALC56_06157 [Trachymyrmex septentrionalis]|uniref:Uncharacterized protein n=1 Tax=Trachymyrmex septentrionalis TaxID=34720 RepID=A0A195FHG5_9HYME|nr:hypothetical protein ALC56_06157 [Trachymyrmex septentrionalis]